MHREDAPLGRLPREHLHRRGVRLEEVAPGFTRANAAPRLEHELVDFALLVGELAADGQRAGDVRGVERVALDARVEQQQVALLDGAVVARPVQDAGVRAGRGDGAVADVVAFDARAQVEDALDLALAAHLRGDAGQLLEHLGEAALRRVDRGAHLGDLVVVLHEAQFGEHAGELGIGLVLGVHLEGERGIRGVRRECLLGGEADAGVVDLLGDGGVGLAQHERGGAHRTDQVLEVLEAAGLDRQVGGDVRERRARADPELADRRVGVELL